MKPLPGGLRPHFYRVRSIAITLLTVLAVLYTLYFARAILIPFTIALLLAILFTPLVMRFRSWRIPPSLSAAGIITLLMAAILVSGNYLIDPAREWLEQAPTSLRQLAREFDEVKKPLEGIQELSEEVDEITEIDVGTPNPQPVAIDAPNPLDQMMAALPTFVMSLLITLFIAFFLLASGEDYARGIMTLGRTWHSRRQLMRAWREIQHEVARHLRTVTLINIGLGVAVGLILWALDIPNPVLWGTMVAVLNFAPYVGAVISTAVLAVVGLTATADLTDALAVPAAYVVVNTLEGLIITPMVLGRRLSLSPLVVFLSVVVWGWIWGVAGALIAVPLVSSLKIVLSQSSATRPLAGLLGPMNGNGSLTPESRRAVRDFAEQPQRTGG